MKAVGQLLLRKLLRLGGVFVFASFLLFVATELSPEDPVSLRVKNPDPEQIQVIRESLGLNDPAPIRFVGGLKSFLMGDWGESLVSGKSVWNSVKEFLPATLELALLALFFGVLIGVGAVLISHVWGWRWLQQVVQSFGMVGLIIPIYWIGLLMIWIFSVQLSWFPSSGRYDYGYSLPTGTGFYLWDTLSAGDWIGFRTALGHLLLPALTLSFYPAALLSGTLEGKLQDPRISKLILALESRGYSKWRIWFVHVLRLLSGPIVTLIGTHSGAMLGGAVLTETVFSWPGMGRYLVQGVLDRDIHIIQNGLLFVLLISLGVVMISDLAANLLNPETAMEES